MGAPMTTKAVHRVAITGMGVVCPIASAIDDFSRELLNSLEEIHVRPVAAQRAPGGEVREVPQEVERGFYK